MTNVEDEGDELGFGRSNQELGVIRIVVRRCIPLSYDAEPTLMHFNSRSPINEKSQKGLLDTRTEYVTTMLQSNLNRLKPEEPYRNGPYANVQYLDNGNPFVEFRYVYKSLSSAIPLFGFNSRVQIYFKQWV